MEVPSRFHETKPHILSIHPTMHCDYHCVGCYLKKDIDDGVGEKNSKFFVELVEVAGKLGMKELAIPMNYSKELGLGKDKNIEYYHLLKEAALRNGMEFTMTCNYDFFTSYPDISLEGIGLVSISLNDFVTGTRAKQLECLRIIRDLKKHIPIVNCNVLLTDHMVKLLSEGLDREVLESSDSIYLLTSKPLRVSLKKAGEWYNRLSETMDIDSDKILMDTCIKYAFGLTSGICDRHQMIYVNPYGEIKMCSFDSKSLAVLNDANDFNEVYNKYFPMGYQSSCKLMGM